MKTLHEILKLSEDKANRFVVLDHDASGFAGSCIYQPPMIGTFKPKSSQLMMIAAWGDGWDHISVSHRSRTPTWAELEHVRHLLALPDETWMQLHVPKADHINVHDHVLHMWRPQDSAIPRPPHYMV